jgi:hypothetical protein
VVETVASFMRGSRGLTGRSADRGSLEFRTQTEQWLDEAVAELDTESAAGQETIGGSE